MHVQFFLHTHMRKRFFFFQIRCSVSTCTFIDVLRPNLGRTIFSPTTRQEKFLQSGNVQPFHETCFDSTSIAHSIFNIHICFREVVIHLNRNSLHSCAKYSFRQSLLLELQNKEYYKWFCLVLRQYISVASGGCC